MADVNLQVQDFMKMFNVGKNGQFSTDEAHTHGKLTLGDDGKLRNVGRYDRGKTDYLGLESSGVRTQDNFKIRAALLKALVNDGVNKKSKFFKAICEKLGVATVQLDDDDGESPPLSRRTVKAILSAHIEAKNNTVKDLASSASFATQFKWADPSNATSFLEQLRHVGKKCRGNADAVDKNCVSVNEFFGVGEPHDGRGFMMNSILNKFRRCKTDAQKRIFCAFVFSENGIKILNENWPKKKDAGVLENYLAQSAILAENISPDLLDAWCSLLVDDPKCSFMDANDVRLIESSFNKLAEKLQNLKKVSILTAKDVKDLQAIVLLPTGQDNDKVMFLQDAIVNLARLSGVLHGGMLDGFLSADNVGKTIDGMLKEFEGTVDDELNKAIFDATSFDENRLRTLCRNLKMRYPDILTRAKEVQRLAQEHMNALQTIGQLLKGVYEMDNDHTRVSSLMLPMSDYNYCPSHFTLAERQKRPVNNRERMCALLQGAARIINFIEYEQKKVVK